MIDTSFQPRLVYSMPDVGRDDVPLQIVDRLRECLFNGELMPGSRLSEPALAARLGVSRTPIRAALQRLQTEGWLEFTATGGYRVRQFSRGDVASALAVHAALEGLAVRLAAEQGAPPSMMSQARELLIRMDLLLNEAEWCVSHFDLFVARHAELHRLLVKMAVCPMIDNTLAHVMAHPLSIAANVFFTSGRTLPDVRQSLVFAQEHHRSVLDAIKRQQGTRAEALIREHAAWLERHLHMADQPATVPFLTRVAS
ncbi:MAG: GntR family transcriptional regulator [Burkholderiales bacterium]|nr:GntR family transcriptional regulator [Burkholderiales bacterium]MDE2075462.1 GntR family transcriptional regulator [Burkholderiales bacterium]MDE2431224.1 GntR family transcriptional regulator [Burkholderiales bacterium]